MSKEKRAADLDAELAALEAELAALESGSAKPKKEPKKAKEKPAAAPSPPPTPAAPAPEAPAAPRVSEPKKRLGLPFGKKKPAPAPEPAPTPLAAATPEPAPAAPPAPTLPAPVAEHDLSMWRQDGTTWIRTVPTPQRTVRRVLDENGALVREEAASGAEVERVDAVKAERGIGKLFRRKGA